MGARVGRSIALSSSQTQGHNITQGSLNQGCAELGRKQTACLKSILSFFLIGERLWSCGKDFTVEQPQCERHIYNPFLIVSFADESYYIEVWVESQFERHDT